MVVSVVTSQMRQATGAFRTNATQATRTNPAPQKTSAMLASRLTRLTAQRASMASRSDTRVTTSV